jgi:uncharacterized coiled-coil protein SlyX
MFSILLSSGRTWTHLSVIGVSPEFRFLLVQKYHFYCLDRGCFASMDLMREPTVEELAERITEMEIRFAYQNRLLEELNAELTESNRRIDLLERDNRRMGEMLERLAPDLTESPDE